MSNPNPYKDISIPGWVEDAFKAGDYETIKKRMQFLLHQKQKFEKCYQREYNRNLKYREQLGLPIAKREVVEK